MSNAPLFHPFGGGSRERCPRSTPLLRATLLRATPYYVSPGIASHCLATFLPTNPPGLVVRNGVPVLLCGTAQGAATQFVSRSCSATHLFAEQRNVPSCQSSGVGSEEPCAPQCPAAQGYASRIEAAKRGSSLRIASFLPASPPGLAARSLVLHVAAPLTTPLRNATQRNISHRNAVFRPSGVAVMKGWVT